MQPLPFWNLPKLMQQVMWPAVAGNVAWGFFTLLMEGNFSDLDYWARLCALLFTAIYLALDWLYTEHIKENLPARYAPHEAVLAALISLFSIAISQEHPKGWSIWVLCMIFALVIFGHSRNAWETDPHIRQLHNRSFLMGVNVVGLLILIGFMAARWFGYQQDFRFIAPAVALGVVVVGWAAQLFWQAKQHSVKDHHAKDQNAK